MLTISPKKGIIVLLAISLFILWYKINFGEDTYTTLSIKLGEDIHETQGHSSSDLQINKHEPNRSTDLFAVVRTTTIFEFRDPKLGFKLPPTELVTIGTENSKVRHVETYPQLHLLNLKDSKLLLKKLSQFFDDIGWQHDNIYHTPAPDDLRSENFALRHEIVIGAWVEGNRHLLLSIKQNLRKEDIKASPIFHYAYAKRPYEDYYLIEVSLFFLPLYSK